MSDVNNRIQGKLELQFVKKEESEYEGKKLFYLLCNFFDSEGMASSAKVKVTEELYNQKYEKGQKLDVMADVSSNYLRITALSVLKLK